MKTLIFIYILFFISSCLYSTIINIPADQPTIQAGIDASVDADTVLVQPGTYFENINYNGKNITVASLFLTTQDTTYISQTVIDGSQLSYPDNASVVFFSNGEDSTAILCGFTICNGTGSLGGGMTIVGGGIYCYGSSPSLINLAVLDNEGGGIYCSNSNPGLENVTITGNSAGSGGGIYNYYNSNPILENVTISNNSALNSGGGVFCYASSNMNLENVKITNNSAGFSGGGIRCGDAWRSDLSLTNVTIAGNSAGFDGGGISCVDNSNLNFMNVTIAGNSANNGGGIHCSNSNLSFDPIDRCNIFLNYANTSGCDLYAYNCNTIDVIVDTFTVLQPDDFFASPIDNYTFDILNAKIEQVDQDLYVSPDGSDENSGLTVDDPLLTISCALVKVLPDSINPLTINLLNGTYSPSGSGEIFPLYCRSNISLIGEEEIFTILDGEGQNRILKCENDTNFSIENMTIQNGYVNYYNDNGGGIYCVNSNLSIKNVTITDSYAEMRGGGIYCNHSSNLSLEDVTLINNSARWGGGIYCHHNSSSSLENVTIIDNFADFSGGGIQIGGTQCLTDLTLAGNFANGTGGGIHLSEGSPILTNINLTNNSANKGGGISCYLSSASLENITIVDNFAAIYGGGIYCVNSNPSLINSILWINSPEEIYFCEGYDPNSITISYSDIHGGEAGIVTNNNGTVNWLEGNIDEDPLFVGTGDHPFMLQDLSPCVNAGIPDTTGLNLPEYDLVGNPRIYGGRIDMGAYENQNVVVGANENLIPLITKLNQNYPNPFNPTTMIKYSLKDNSKVSLNIYNIKGQKVKQLDHEVLPAGQHSIVWDGRDDNGKPVSSGIYFYKLKTNNYEKTRRMILIK